MGVVNPSGFTVGNPTKQPLIAIIGGIASGKSTVAAEFKKLGCALIDADQIAHELLTEEEVRNEVVRLFGPEVLTASSEIDRRRLGRVVFTDARKLAALNEVIHPRVLQRTEALIAQYRRDRNIPAIVLDMPLLVEVGWADRCDRIIFVKCDRATRMERAKDKGLGSEQDIKIRENFQISLDKKIGLADNTVDSNSDFSTLVRQINDIFSDITKNG